MKKALCGLLAVICFSFPAFAEDFAGLKIPIPETWKLEKSDPSEDGNSVMNIYEVADEEYVIVYVQNVGFLNEDAQIMANMYLADCGTAYGDNEGYYLMTDAETKTNDLLTKMQDCVYQDISGQWQYVFLGSRNRGDYVITLIYQAQTTSLRLGYTDFILLYNNFVAE